MFSQTYTGMAYGVEGTLIQVEADVGEGLPIFDMVGFLGTGVKEAKERVKIALKNSGYRVPPKRITVNLSPADLPKEGSYFDLAIAIAILISIQKIPQKKVEHMMFIGELGFNGKLRKVDRILPLILCAKKNAFTVCVVPKENAKEAAMVHEIDIIAVGTLQEAIAYLLGRLQLQKQSITKWKVETETARTDINYIYGQEVAKRAMQIAVAGMHHLLLVGAPGCGKTLLAKSIPAMMPDLTEEEGLDLLKLYQLSDSFQEQEIISLRRPFRAPHHTITKTAFIGGGRNAAPGEVSLATKGVLFLDEITEFDKSVLETLRQPLEDRYIRVQRSRFSFVYPADIMLVAAMNACPCGAYPDQNRCHCSNRQIRQYRAKLSQALLQRIDLCVQMQTMEYKETRRNQKWKPFSEIRRQMQCIWEIQKKRYQEIGISHNAQLPGDFVEKYCGLETEEERMMEKMFLKWNWSTREYHKILKVARTIADIEGEEKIKRQHLQEAMVYRDARWMKE